jgi:hypothetical protein
MVAFFLLVLASVVAGVWLLSRRLREHADRPVAVPLDDAPPGVLDAIVAQLRQRPDAA